MDNKSVLQDDILRYKKNKFASSFALLALVFNCLYFTVLYAVCVTELYRVALGFSVIVNLLVLLSGFYASEGIKGYNKKFAIVLLVLAVIQVIRAIYFPVIGAAKGWLNDSNLYFGIKMTNAANATVSIIYLVASAACFVVAAVHGYIVATRLEKFQKKIDSGEISIDETLAEINAEETAKEAEAAKAANQAEAAKATKEAANTVSQQTVKAVEEQSAEAVAQPSAQPVAEKVEGEDTAHVSGEADNNG